jgi:pyruvate/2-oxoglutarate dehydrogenase complex dihydrolipoamide dehydrogenase (E3) component
VTLRLGEKVPGVAIDEHDRVEARLESGKSIRADGLLYAFTVGRQANTDLLNPEAAGLTTDPRGRLAVNGHLQTAVPHIYAAGDVIGFPALASAAMEQGDGRASRCSGSRPLHFPAAHPTEGYLSGCRDSTPARWRLPGGPIPVSPKVTFSGAA